MCVAHSPVFNLASIFLLGSPEHRGSEPPRQPVFADHRWAAGSGDEATQQARQDYIWHGREFRGQEPLREAEESGSRAERTEVILPSQSEYEMHQDWLLQYQIKTIFMYTCIPHIGAYVTIIVTYYLGGGGLALSMVISMAAILRDKQMDSRVVGVSIATAKWFVFMLGFL